MHMTKLRAVGGSVMFAIPKALLASLDLEADASVGVSVSEGKLIVDPHPKPRYTLAELLAQCDDSAPRTDEDETWLTNGPVGREEI
ncbi:MAG TPA: antitoxin [Chloroflexota bacterium]|nr:antitoxin [Chloroflexota bacterium]